MKGGKGFAFAVVEKLKIEDRLQRGAGWEKIMDLLAVRNGSRRGTSSKQPDAVESISGYCPNRVSGFQKKLSPHFQALRIPLDCNSCPLARGLSHRPWADASLTKRH